MLKLTSLSLAALAVSAVAASAVPVQWKATEGGNDHWYDFIAGAIQGQDAPADANLQSFMGMTGYLATITSAAENTFVTSLIRGPVWISGSDAAQEGTFVYNSGPEIGQALVYDNFAAGEPNNAGSGEDFIELRADGQWNDYFNTDTRPGYIVEYSAASVAPVPLPAGLGLLAGALGAMGVWRRRQSA